MTDLGITVVTAAGNLGTNALGLKQYGGIMAPGNAPWVLTVGAIEHDGHGDPRRRHDGELQLDGVRRTRTTWRSPTWSRPARASSRWRRRAACFSTTKLSVARCPGKLSLGTKPYLSLSGTSMAAPVVSGTVALMLQANPNLTPNLIKGILMYTAQDYHGYKALEQGAGFLNTYGAVRLAQVLRDAPRRRSTCRCSARGASTSSGATT